MEPALGQFAVWLQGVPNFWLRPPSFGPASGQRLGESRFCLAPSPYLFFSLAAEEAGLDDSTDSGWRLCLRLHGPLHPEGLSPDGHELPFLFEQVRISSVHAPTPQILASLNPSLSGPSHFIVMATSREALLEPRPWILHPEVSSPPLPR